MAPSVVTDSPINLNDPEVLTRNPGALPHMRFLLCDKQMLEMTFILLICGPRVGNSITLAEKSKIEDCLELLIGDYFRCDHSFKQLKAASKQIQLLSEEEISLLTKNPSDYYRAKVQDGFKFHTWGDRDDQENAITLNLPFPQEESVLECDSNEGGKPESNQNSQPNSSSDSSSLKRQPTAADLKQLINLQEQTADLTGQSGNCKNHGLLEPPFKEGYSLIFGTHHLYLVFKTIASIYERLVKGRQLIAEKVEMDLKRSEVKDIVGLDGKNLASFKEQVIIERFKLFINALVGTLSQTPHKKLDPSNYEDIVR